MFAGFYYAFRDSLLKIIKHNLYILLTKMEYHGIIMASIAAQQRVRAKEDFEMAKFNIDNYEFINVSEDSESNLENLSANEIEEMIEATVEVLKGSNSIKRVPTNLCLVSGLLGVRGGEFKKISPIKVSFKKGDVSKDELKVINKVFTKGRIYYLLRNVGANVAGKQIGVDGIYPYLARRKGN